MSYARLIQQIAPATVGEYDPRHIEAYIRTGHSTLGHLSREDFTAEIKIATACIDAVGVDQAERAAKSWGL